MSCGKKTSPVPKILSSSHVVNDLSGEVKDGVLFLSFSIRGDELKGKELEGFKVIKEEMGGEKEGKKRERFIRIDSKGVFTTYKGRLYFFDDELIPNLTYTYRVSLYLKDGIVLGSSNQFSIKWKKPPDSVTCIEAKVEEGVVHITWPKEEGFLYNVYRYEKGSYALFPLNEKPIDLSYYRDADIKKEGTYIYEVRKIKKEENFLWEGEGRSTEVTFIHKKVLPVPYNVRAERKKDGIHISWEIEKKEDIKGFKVFRYFNGKQEKIAETRVEDNTFVDIHYPKTRYVLYYVRSVGYTGNESEDSNNAIVHLGDE